MGGADPEGTWVWGVSGYVEEERGGRNWNGNSVVGMVGRLAFWDGGLTVCIGHEVGSSLPVWAEVRGQDVEPEKVLRVEC